MEELKNDPRRRFFGRAALGTLLGGLAAGIGFKAYGHGGWMRGGFMADAAMLDERIERMLKHAYVEIDATDAQKAKLAPIVKSAAKDLLPLRERLREARKQAIALLSAERIDREAIERLRAAQLATADEASRRLARAIADVGEVLMPAQRKDLAERFARRHRGWHRS